MTTSGRRDQGREVERLRVEEAFAQTFIVPRKRGRFIEVASKRDLPAKLHRKGLKRLSSYHGLLANLEHAVHASHWRSSPEASKPGYGLLELLEGLGAPEECYVMSMNRSTDATFALLEPTITALSTSPHDATLVVMRPGSLAYYWQGELADASAVLHAPS